MNLKGIQLSFLAIFISFSAVAAEGKINLTAGYFGISAKTNDKTSNIGNPSAFRAAYQYPFMDKFEAVAGYSILLADFSGTDMGYGLDLGVHYYPITMSSDQVVRDPHIEVKSHENYSPFIGLGFYQRQFQSVKNSYAGLGATVGVEKYYDKKINFKAEARYITLGGSGESTATEMNFLVGIVYKL